ncbi:MAG: VanZ family protein, partial [Lachnospiraceae bacterium]|nr:VanZ family protein [Lachnospiraceae bacterium]
IYLIWAVLFKFSFSYAEIPSRRQSVNLDPFFMLYGPRISRIFIREKLMNILIFIPFGAYLYLLGSRKFIPSILVMLLTSILFEIIQYVFSLGTCDIADIITNAFGGAAGYLLAKMTFKISGKEERLTVHFAVMSAVITPVVIIGTLWMKVKYG